MHNTGLFLKTRWSRVAWRGDWLFHTLLNSLNWRTDLHCSFMALSQVHFSFSPRFFFLSQRSYPSIHGHISTQQVETTFKDSKHLSHLLVNGEHFYSPFFWCSEHPKQFTMLRFIVTYFPIHSYTDGGGCHASHQPVQGEAVWGWVSRLKTLW